MSNAFRPYSVYAGPGSSIEIKDALRARGAISAATYTDYEASCADLREHAVIVTALDPTTRRRLVDRVTVAGGSFGGIRPTSSAVSESVGFGTGSIVTDGTIFIGRKTEIGRHVIIMSPASIGHDCLIGAFVTIYPLVAISGYVVIEDDVTIGVGAVISNGRSDRPLRIGHGAHIMAGSAVMSSVAPAATVRGNPATIVRT